MIPATPSTSLRGVEPVLMGRLTSARDGLTLGTLCRTAAATAHVPDYAVISALHRLERSGLARAEEGRWRPTPKGRALARPQAARRAASRAS
jgi:hypothetical protein